MQVAATSDQLVIRITYFPIKSWSHVPRILTKFWPLIYSIVQEFWSITEPQIEEAGSATIFQSNFTYTASWGWSDSPFRISRGGILTPIRNNSNGFLCRLNIKGWIEPLQDGSFHVTESETARFLVQAGDVQLSDFASMTDQDLKRLLLLLKQIVIEFLRNTRAAW